MPGDVTAVHYNNRSIAPLRLSAHAARHSMQPTALCGAPAEPRFQLKYRLATGDLVAFDNQRTLHGRTGFSSAKFPRHLRGCYLARDSVYSQAALLRRAVSGGSSK